MTPNALAWVRYLWASDDFEPETRTSPRVTVRPAAASEGRAVRRTACAAYSAEPVWARLCPAMIDKATRRIPDDLRITDTWFWVADHDRGIVAVTRIARTYWTGEHSITGVCVSPESQRRGPGTRLRGLSLTVRREMGVTQACAFTVADSVADRNLYPRFGSRRHERVWYGDAPDPSYKGTW